MHTNAHKYTDGLGTISENALKQRGFPLFVQPEKQCFCRLHEKGNHGSQEPFLKSSGLFMFVLIRVNMC